MYTPTKQQWQTVIDNFEKVMPMAINEGHLNMDEWLVNTPFHKCGTVHCAGGWYAIAALDVKENTSGIDFIDGANAMAAHLGFPSRSYLEQWARRNPDIWGARGELMFSDKSAYDYAETLEDIVDYLKGVRDRTPGTATTDKNFIRK